MTTGVPHVSSILAGRGSARRVCFASFTSLVRRHTNDARSSSGSFELSWARYPTELLRPRASCTPSTTAGARGLCSPPTGTSVAVWCGVTLQCVQKGRQDVPQLKRNWPRERVQRRQVSVRSVLSQGVVDDAKHGKDVPQLKRNRPRERVQCRQVSVRSVLSQGVVDDAKHGNTQTCMHAGQRQLHSSSLS